MGVRIPLIPSWRGFMFKNSFLAVSMIIMALVAACGDDDTAPGPTTTQSTFAPGATPITVSTPALISTPTIELYVDDLRTLAENRGEVDQGDNSGLTEAEKPYNEGGEPEQKGGFLPEALAAFAEAIRLNPGLGLPYYNRGVAYTGLARYELAIQDFDEAIRLNPLHVDAYYRRGRVYADRGHLERALQDFDEAIRLDSDVALGYIHRALTYEELGQFERAVRDYDEAIRLQPQHANAYAGRALTYTIQGKDMEAQNDVDRAVELGFSRRLIDRLIEDYKINGPTYREVATTSTAE